MPIKTIAHLADIHIRRSIGREKEYREVFENLYNSLRENKPDRIVIVGDLVNENLQLEPEQIILASEFLNKLTEISPVRIVRGNHDFNAKSKSRVDSVKGIVESISNKNIEYYDQTRLYEDENVIFANWLHGDIKNNNPWNKKNLIYDKSKVTIDLFHDPVNGSTNQEGYSFNRKTYRSLSDFKGDFSLFGDIHKMQFLNKDRTKAYCGSLIAQNFGEGNESFHGYLLWNIEEKSVKEIEIKNNFSFKNITVNIFTDFSDLSGLEIENPTEYMRIRVIWKCYPATKTKENQRNVETYLKNKYPNTISLTHKDEFIEEETIETTSEQLQNITDLNIQHEIFVNYLTKIGTDEKIIDEILELDDVIGKRISVEEFTRIEWDIIFLKAKNFMSYEDFEIDFSEKDGIFQIHGENANGKTTIFKAISYVLYNKTLETESKMKYGDMRYVNNKNNAKFCDVSIVIEGNNEYYGLRRRTDLEFTRDGELKGAPTHLFIYKLNSPTDELTDENSIESLNENERKYTQERVSKIIGSYETFNKIVLTTSDTLNNVLDADPASFIDELLFSAGLDIFDAKLEEMKLYEKELNLINRISCNPENTKQNIEKLIQSNLENENLIKVEENENLKNLTIRIENGEKFINDTNKKLHTIDPEIYKLNVSDVTKDIQEHFKNIEILTGQKAGYEENIKLLKETYDEKALQDALLKKDEHKAIENNYKLKIKDIERIVSELDHKIELINGEIYILKRDGGKLKEDVKGLKDEILEIESEIQALENSKNAELPLCPTCGEKITPEHMKHIDENILQKKNKTQDKNKKIENIVVEMNRIASQIYSKQNNDIELVKKQISENNLQIENIRKEISSLAIQMESTLRLIGDLNNDKNDVEKRKEIQGLINNIPLQIENENLKILALKKKIEEYNRLQKQILENNENEKIIVSANQRLILLKEESLKLIQHISDLKNDVKNNISKKSELEKLLKDFEAQEKRDELYALYKKILNRNNLPKTILATQIIPKINISLRKLLSDSQFNIWLDPEDIKLKMAYKNTPDSIINCISGSGMERTFSSIALKHALNEVNQKSKPKIILLDEVMGKLVNESVENFVILLQLMKERMSKIFIIEHNHYVHPDHVISTSRNENGVTSLMVE